MAVKREQENHKATPNVFPLCGFGSIPLFGPFVGGFLRVFAESLQFSCLNSGNLSKRELVEQAKKVCQKAPNHVCGRSCVMIIRRILAISRIMRVGTSVGRWNFFALRRDLVALGFWQVVC